jgi:hypothetical protein
MPAMIVASKPMDEFINVTKMQNPASNTKSGTSHFTKEISLRSAMAVSGVKMTDIILEPIKEICTTPIIHKFLGEISRTVQAPYIRPIITDPNQVNKKHLMIYFNII